MKNQPQSDSSVWKGMASGLVAGLAASYVMNQFQSGLSALLANGEQSKAREKEKQEQGGNSEPATVKAAEAISETVTNHELTREEKKVAGPVMHYAMGATSGAVYGLATELQPYFASASGLPFGAAVWLLADEVAVPSLGLSGPPTETPVANHLEALASHFVYGVTTDVLRRAIRKAL